MLPQAQFLSNSLQKKNETTQHDSNQARFTTALQKRMQSIRENTVNELNSIDGSEDCDYKSTLCKYAYEIKLK